MAASHAVSIGFGETGTWRLQADEPWWALVDVREMLNLFHPLVISETGKSAGASTTLTLPADWKPPFALRFFCADDYFADEEKHRPGQLGTESYFEHRFKQVLVDDRVVWERDVADENIHGSQTIFLVDLTPYVTAGKPFKLTFRVLDQVTTAERNKRDVRFIGGTWYSTGDGKTEEPPRFHTAVWFADPVVGEKTAVEKAPEGQRPHDATVIARHNNRWPLPPPSEFPELPVELSLVAPAVIPSPGFPLTCGLPMPPGLLRDPERVGLCDAAGSELPVQAEATGFWPDGSLRWVLLHTIVPPGTAPGTAFTLYERSPGPTASSLTITGAEKNIRMDTGAVQVELAGNPAILLDRVSQSDAKTCLKNLQLRMTVLRDGKPQPVEARWENIDVIERGPVRAQIELSGTLTTEDITLGRFLFRLYAYAGLPTLQAQFRLFNDTKPEPYTGTIDDAPLDITDLALVAELPGAGGSLVVGMAAGEPIALEGEAVSVLQDTAEHCAISVDGTAIREDRRASGWIAAGMVQAALHNCWQQYPKRLAIGGGKLEIALFTPSAGMPLYSPRFGEAKRHDLWLNFCGESAAFGLLAGDPPRLFSGDWFCRGGAVNLLDPDWFARHPRLCAWMEESNGDFSPDRYPGHFGIRDYGDAPYKTDTRQWLNGYWAMVQGTLNWGLASGSRACLERSFDIARHLADIDAVHLPADHPDWSAWDGMTCALGADHSVHDELSRWAAFQLGESLMLHYWITGDPDSRDAALANAEWIIRNAAGLGSSEARSQARPLLTLLRAWEATGDTRYREAAHSYLDLRYQIEHVIDWRRGAYIQPTYENWRCVSAGLDSMYAMNIYEYYRLTGDLDAARLVVAVADSIYAESMLPREEGLGSFLYYVRYDRGSWYYTQMAILFHLAYDLTEDLRFLRAGRAAFARYLLCQTKDGKPHYQSVGNFGWLDPEYGGWERHFAAVETATFTITSQTPEPDPARY